MILAHIPHKNEILEVEVIDAFTTGDGRKLATVRTLDGSRPFTQHSFNGGPVESNTAVIPAGLLADVAVTVDAPALIDRAALAAYVEARGW